MREAMAKTTKNSKSGSRTNPVALRLRVKGPGIKHGRIPIPELIEICKHAQQAVNRQAEVLEGRVTTLHPGPKTEKVRLECTLDLVELGVGSAVLGFDQSKAQPNLPAYGQLANLGQMAIRDVGKGLQAFKTGKPAHLDQGVLASLDALGEVLDRRVVTSIDWIVPSRPGVRGVTATMNPQVKARVARQLKAPTTDTTTLDGVLEMADFKPGDLKCRVHPAVGPAVTCAFDESLEDDVYGNLRRAVQLKGVATINPHNGRVEEIQIKSLTPLDPLRMNAKAFFAGVSLSELALAQSVDPVKNPRQLAGAWPDDDDVDEAVAEIYRQRF